MDKELSKLIHTIILNSPIPAKSLAEQIGKPYSTLLREVNPYDPGAKLGIETFVDILKITGDISPIQYIADQLGYTVVEKNLRKTG